MEGLKEEISSFLVVTVLLFRRLTQAVPPSVVSVSSSSFLAHRFVASFFLPSFLTRAKRFTNTYSSDF